MSALDNLKGRKFGHLTVIELVRHSSGDKSQRKTKWACRCDCGNESVATATNLKSGNTQSCGCHRDHVLAEVRRSHGMTGTPTWSSWRSMLRRCNGAPGNRSHRYKERGIAIDPRWLDLRAFCKDMGLRPSLEHSIERVDNDGPYCAENCVWGTAEVQANNRSTNRFVEFNGEVKTIAQWCRQVNLQYATVKARLDRGLPAEQAFFSPVGRGGHEQ